MDRWVDGKAGKVRASINSAPAIRQAALLGLLVEDHTLRAVDDPLLERADDVGRLGVGGKLALRLTNTSGVAQT